MEGERFALMELKVHVWVPASTPARRGDELADLFRSYIDKTMSSVEAHLRSLYEPQLDIEVEE